jgi:membrane protease YdiL (CAAX protease family)
MKKNRKGLLFVLLTYGISWAIGIAFPLMGGKWNTASATAVALVYMFIPALVAVVVQREIFKDRLKPLGISFKWNRWWVVGWLIPPVLAFAALGVALLFPDVSFSAGMEGMYERFSENLTPEQIQQMKEQAEAFPVHPIWIGLLQALVAGITVNALAGFGEELGWRGLLQKELSNMGFWSSSALIGLIWGVWHAPLILQGHNYPDHPVIGVFMMIAWTILLSPLFSLVRLKSGSVIAAAILHGTLNASYGLAIFVLKGGSDLTVGMTGLAGFIVLAVVNLGIAFYVRGPVSDRYPEIAVAATHDKEEKGENGIAHPDQGEDRKSISD